MPLYFMLHDAIRFHETIVPALTASWRQRSFLPCRDLCSSLNARVAEFTRSYQGGAGDFLLTKIPTGLTFDRGYWRLLTGEVLLLGADELPELQTMPETLAALLASDCADGDMPDRQSWAPIRQAHHGSRDLQFGDAFYRPESVGLNDVADVSRLADHLASVRQQDWSAARLISLKELVTEEEREDELSFAREWFPSLLRLYQQAASKRQVVVCEDL